MKNLKTEIANIIEQYVNISVNELEEFIEIPKDCTNGDYAFPCFKLAKELRKAPQMIATELKDKIVIQSPIDKIEVAGGYLNFFIEKSIIIEEVFEEYDLKKDKFGSSDYGKGKKIVIDYSHPNIAKPFHIGHLRSTVIGQALYNIHEFLGYEVSGLNYLGDYGTQFGKMIEAYKLWGNEYNIEDDPINKMMEMYVRINTLCKEDEAVLENCRNNFKLLENGDKYCVDLWERFRKISLAEFKKIYDVLGGKFDSWDGEAFIAPKVPEVMDILNKTGKVVVSEGAKIIDLTEKDMPPCMIEKSDGSSTYAVRDLAAILYRARTYDYDKSLYVTSYEQILHFKQVFETAKLLGMDEKYVNGLVHVPFGMVLLPTGKMSTREGTVIKLEDLLNESIQRAEKIIEEKNPSLENKKEIAKKVGIGAVIFNDLSNNRIKDEIFDWDTLLNFQGETGPYVQYIYVRTKSVIEKAGYLPEYKDVNIQNITDEASMNVIKRLYMFEDTVKIAADKNEPSIIARYLVDVAQGFSSFYVENHIVGEEKEIQDARLYLTAIVGDVLKTGLELLGIETPEKM